MNNNKKKFFLFKALSKKKQCTYIQNFNLHKLLINLMNIDVVCFTYPVYGSNVSMSSIVAVSLGKRTPPQFQFEELEYLEILEHGSLLSPRSHGSTDKLSIECRVHCNYQIQS